MTKSRQQLFTQRSSEASAMRETRTQLREKHKSRLQEEYLEKAAIV